MKTAIEKYSPAEYNIHALRITFNKDGYTGHIALKVGGNCKGIAVIEVALSFINDCDTSDIKHLKENDCEFSMYDDEEPYFKMVLKGKDEEMTICGLDSSEVEKMVVAVEIVDCEPEIR